MATGRLAAVNVPQAANTTIYTVPSSKIASIAIRVLNKSDSNSALLSLALSTSDTPTDAEWIEYELILGPKDTLEETNIVLGEGDKVVAYTSRSEVNIVITGVEQ